MFFVNFLLPKINVYKSNELPLCYIINVCSQDQVFKYLSIC